MIGRNPSQRYFSSKWAPCFESDDKGAFHGVVYSFEPLGTKSVLTIDATEGCTEGHKDGYLFVIFVTFCANVP